MKEWTKSFRVDENVTILDSFALYTAIDIFSTSNN